MVLVAHQLRQLSLLLGAYLHTSRLPHPSHLLNRLLIYFDQVPTDCQQLKLNGFC